MKPQDIIVLIKLHTWKIGRWTIASLAHSVHLSESATHAAIKRLTKASLYDPVLEKPRQRAMEEFLIHGLKYVFPAELSEEVKGMPTAHSANPLAKLIASNPNDQVVWPYPRGKMKGRGLKPLYKTVPEAAQGDLVLYEFLALIDAIRGGRAREQALAEKELLKRIRSKS